MVSLLQRTRMLVLPDENPNRTKVGVTIRSEFPESTNPAGTGKKPVARILLIEDNEMNRDMLSRRLVRKGYEVILAKNGEEGVEAARRDLPNLILMDMSLPVMNGWDATRLLKQKSATAHIPIVALTAHALNTDREKAMEAGCDGYETKPVDLPRLLETIEQLLAGSSGT
jgi:CheY-like chemotaxis protein